MSAEFPLPHEIAQYVGPLLAVDYPPQGMGFQVAFLTSARGRFVLKLAHTPAAARELEREAFILTTLKEHVPFVAQPLAAAATSDRYACLFTYLEGEPLHVVLQHSDTGKRHRLLAQWGYAMRKVHSWTPELPRPADWLTATLSWLRTNIEAHPANEPVAHTNSRFDGCNARQLLAELEHQRSGLNNDIVFGHYDYCLPNALVQDQRVTSIIDWSGGGYIDRRFDLATALFSMRLSEPLQRSEYESAFLRAYGYSEPLDTLYFFEALHALTCAFWQ